MWKSKLVSECGMWNLEPQSRNVEFWVIDRSMDVVVVVGLSQRIAEQVVVVAVLVVVVVVIFFAFYKYSSKNQQHASRHTLSPSLHFVRPTVQTAPVSPSRNLECENRLIPEFGV